MDTPLVDPCTYPVAGNQDFFPEKERFFSIQPFLLS
jgi:hypothetical protein